MTAPSVATTIDQMLNPVAPLPPSRPTTSPPTTAPTIPMRVVTIIPPGSSPGIISLARAPAISPTKIQLIIPNPLRFLPFLGASFPGFVSPSGTERGPSGDRANLPGAHRVAPAKAMVSYLACRVDDKGASSIRVAPGAGPPEAGASPPGRAVP